MNRLYICSINIIPQNLLLKYINCIKSLNHKVPPVEQTCLPNKS